MQLDFFYIYAHSFYKAYVGKKKKNKKSLIKDCQYSIMLFSLLRYGFTKLILACDMLYI